ncbi:hypothetical protein C8R43DRAFT_1238550 [Mycena crocata]|nr:hypothetical protein C8R43DRAFT_1238550 [Mycena crocata]
MPQPLPKKSRDQYRVFGYILNDDALLEIALKNNLGTTEDVWQKTWAITRAAERILGQNRIEPHIVAGVVIQGEVRTCAAIASENFEDHLPMPPRATIEKLKKALATDKEPQVPPNASSALPPLPSPQTYDGPNPHPCRPPHRAPRIIGITAMSLDLAATTSVYRRADAPQPMQSYISYLTHRKRPAPEHLLPRIALVLLPTFPVRSAPDRPHADASAQRQASEAKSELSLKAASFFQNRFWLQSWRQLKQADYEDLPGLTW